jgi:dipeptidyl-peptidase 4
MTVMAGQDSFPRQQARTQRFTLGVPRAITVSPDGGRVVFLRTPSGTSSANGLWTIDSASGTERLIADPSRLLGDGGEMLTPEERARRERARERASGIVGYATDSAVTTAAFVLSSRLFVADLVDGAVRELPVTGPVHEPRIDPTGRHIAYVSNGELRVVSVDGSNERALLTPESIGITYGLAEFIALEEMHRSRGYWWSPDGGRLLVARVDERPVARWFIACLVTLDGERTDVDWDIAEFCYLTTAHWSAGGPPLMAVQDRAQQRIRTLTIDVASGTTSTLVEEADPTWVEIPAGGPAWTPGGELVRLAVRGGRVRLLIGDRTATGADLQVRAILNVADDGVLVSASEDDPTRTHVYRVSTGPDVKVQRITDEPGMHTAAAGGRTVVVTSLRESEPGRAVEVLSVDDGAVRRVAEVRSVAETPLLTARPTMLTLGSRELRGALLLPRDHVPGTRLPVLLDPYGGPHVQMAVAANAFYLESQWFADQGFAVLVIDGRGTPGRDVAWEKAIHHDFAGATLEDQVDGLHAAASQHPDLDLDRVAIRGWSYGGYLSALAVLRRPDVFHAAVAGAPVTDWRLYDTHYTERYLGHPDDHPEVYERNSLLSGWAEPHRPLMLIHGLADDNVVSAHTLRLSSALLSAGRPHEVLPLSGVTHMASQETVAENLMVLQIEFLKRALAR